jgi:tetratricopeptide (TPR) repeat protein
MPVRHQTLRAAIEWSYELLAPGEQGLFRALATFAGGATFEAVEAAVHATAHPETDVFAGLATLVEQSLLTQREEEGKPRYLMLETIREYGLEQLSASDDAEAVNDGHARFYLNLAEEAAPKLTGPRQQEWLQRLEREQDNMRAALRWTQERDLVSALRIASALYRFWETRGYAVEGRRWLDSLLAQPETRLAAIPEGVYCKALYAAADLNYALQEYNLASTLLDRIGSRLDANEHPSEITEAMNLQGLIALDRGERARAQRLFELCVERRRELGEKRGLATALLNLGHALDDNERAIVYLDESVRLFKEVGDLNSSARALTTLGLFTQSTGRLIEAASSFERSLSLHRMIGDNRGIAMALNNLGQTEWFIGHYEKARILLEESLALRRSLSDKRGAALALLNLGNLSRDTGETNAAIDCLAESASLCGEIGFSEIEIYALASLGRALIRVDLARADKLLSETVARCRSLDSILFISLCRMYHADCRRSLGYFEQALSAYLQSAQNFVSMTEHLYLPECFEGMAMSCSGLGHYPAAAALFAGAGVLRKSLGMPVPAVDKQVLVRSIQTCRTSLGASAFALEQSQAELMQFDELLALVPRTPGDEKPSLN